MACKSRIFCSGVEARYRTGTANSCRPARRDRVRGRPCLAGRFEQRMAGEPTGRTTRNSLAAWLAWRSVMAGDPYKDASSMQTPSNSPHPTAEISSERRRGNSVSKGADARRGGLLTTAQAAAALGVSERTVRRYLSSGLLTCRRLPGGHYRIPAEALAEFWHANDPDWRHHRLPRSGRTPNSPRPDRQRRDPSRSARRQLRLGEEAPRDYDLSTATLRALRARLS